MCYKAESQGDSANTWAFIATFSIWKTLVYATPSMVKLSSKFCKSCPWTYFTKAINKPLHHLKVLIPQRTLWHLYVMNNVGDYVIIWTTSIVTIGYKGDRWGNKPDIINLPFKLPWMCHFSSCFSSFQPTISRYYTVVSNRPLLCCSGVRTPFTNSC